MLEVKEDLLDRHLYPTLAASQGFSLKIIDQLKVWLVEHLADFGGSVCTVAAAGSLGRLEACDQSDVDYMVILDDRFELDSNRLAHCMEQFSCEIVRLGLRTPKAHGIYTKPIKKSALLNPASRGSLAETPAIFGTRMQILLDARPLYQVQRFVDFRHQLIDWYSESSAHSAGYTHLFNDLCRYLHAYAVWQQFKFTRTDDDGWYLRQAKFRSTRILTFAAMMFLLGESCRREEQHNTWMLSELERTPLGRIQSIWKAYSDADFAAVLEVYEQLHARLSDPAVRRELIEHSPASADDVPLPEVGAYAEIHELSATLMACLTEFILARRDDWPLLIFRNWLL